MSDFWSLEIIETAPSTQDIVKNLAIAGADEGIAVQAMNQTSGKGRQGREWISQPGNLFISVLLRPKGGPQEMGQLSLMTAVALAKSLENITLKWPNDVLKDGRKCAGILLEREGEALVIGVGVNIVSAPEGFASVGGSAEKLRDKFLYEMEALYKHWQKHGFDDIREQWLEYGPEHYTNMKIKIGNEIREGSFEGLDENGNLLFDDAQTGLRTISSGEVYVTGD